MPNLRIIADDAALRATVAASSTAPGLSVTSLLTDEPADVHRMIGTFGSYFLSFARPELIGGVHRPWSNDSPTSEQRVRGYADAGRTQLLFDTGWAPCCPARAREIRGWTPEQAASAYRYGGGAHARTWFDNTEAQYVQIDVNDPDNQQGYLECGRLVIGPWWSPAETADIGASLTPGTLSTPSRNGAGTMRPKVGTKFDKQSIPLSHFAADDRAQFLGIVKANDIDVPFIFSLYPDDEDPELERDHQGYYYFVTPPALTVPGFERYATTVEMVTV